MNNGSVLFWIGAILICLAFWWDRKQSRSISESQIIDTIVRQSHIDNAPHRVKNFDMARNMSNYALNPVYSRYHDLSLGHDHVDEIFSPMFNDLTVSKNSGLRIQDNPPEIFYMS